MPGQISLRFGINSKAIKSAPLPFDAIFVSVPLKCVYPRCSRSVYALIVFLFPSTPFSTRTRRAILIIHSSGDCGAESIVQRCLRRQQPNRVPVGRVRNQCCRITSEQQGEGDGGERGFVRRKAPVLRRISNVTRARRCSPRNRSSDPRVSFSCTTL